MHYYYFDCLINDNIFDVVLGVGSGDETPVEQPKKLYISSPSATRIQLPDGQHLAYEEQRVSVDRARFSLIAPHSFLKSRLAGSHLALEAIAGPSHGINCCLQSANMSMLQMTLGRVPPSDLVLNDSEVSGKHARIDWNANVHTNGRTRSYICETFTKFGTRQ